MQLSARGASLMLVLVTLIWGGGFVASEFAMRGGMGPTWILLFRFVIGSIVVLVCFFRQIRHASKRSALHGIVAGILLYFGFLTQIVGQSMTTVPNTAFLTSTNVIMVPFFIWVFARRRPRPRVFVLCLVAMVGTLLLTMDGELRLTPSLGDGLVLLCAFLYAAHIAFLDLVCSSDPSVPVTFWQLLTCAVLSAVSLFLFPLPMDLSVLRSNLLPVLYLGLFSTGACYLMQTKAQTVLSGPRASIVMSLEGFFGTVLSLLAGLADFRPAMALGGLLITGAVICSTISDASQPGQALP